MNTRHQLDNVEFIASFPTGDYKIIISSVNGSGGSLFIYINQYYSGTINKSGDIYWTPDSPRGALQLGIADWFDSDDRDAIMDRLVEAGWISRSYENNTDN